ncbi:MAG: hypothetical protein NZ703_03715 [Gemmataceae bacterium]|nr:hypothetical protein [Gemmataceae bacterium]MCS7270170.1 hypothetical protein [Gemmataceae bacterium]MDW8244442.1 hypothetical protein [Thermogemmata sp.]
MTVRVWGTVGILLVMSLWAGAHGPPPAVVPAAEHARLFRQHRALVETLVVHGLDMAASRDSLQRAEECRRTARTLGQSLQRAASERDASRLRQLTELLSVIIVEGLAPNLQEAARLIPADSPDARRVRDIRDRSRAELSALRRQLSPEPSTFDTWQPVLEATMQQLTSLESQLRLPDEEAATPSPSPARNR